jgi:hypothetical protein
MGSVVTELMGSDVEGHSFHLRRLTPGEVAEDEETFSRCFTALKNM